MNKRRDAPPSFVPPSLAALDALDVDTLVLGTTTDGRPLAGAFGYADWRLCGRLSRLIERGVVTGAPDEKVLTSTEGMLPFPRVLLYGFGPMAKISDDGKARLARLVSVLDDAKATRVAIDLPAPGRALVPLVDEGLRAPLGERLVALFAPEEEAPRPR